MAAKLLVYKAVRTFFVALTYYLSDKFPECVALCSRSKEFVRSAKDHLREVSAIEKVLENTFSLRLYS